MKAAFGLVIVAILGFFAVFFGESILARMERPYLIPWVLATGAVIIAPVIYLLRKEGFVFINPVVYPSVVYFFPVFFVGGWSLAFGWSGYHFLNYVSDPEWNFPLTFVYIMLGLAGLAVGFLLPTGKKIGAFISTLLPDWEFKTGELFFLSTGFLLVGVYLLVSAIDTGLMGYQGGIEADQLVKVGSLGAFLALTVPTSLMFLWIAFFRIPRWNLTRSLILVVALSTSLFAGVSAGAKAGIFAAFLSFAFALVLTKRRISMRKWALVGTAGLVLLFIGFSFGNVFRNQKGYERVSVEQYYQAAIESIFKAGSDDIGNQVSSFQASFFERIEIASSFAVIVSNHELLARYEAAYGLEDNIWKYTWTAFIPRFIWNDKPVIADTHSFNDLYMDSAWSGYSITVFGDLLRNFGPLGIPVGMLLVGLMFRILYSALIEDLPSSSWKGVLYIMVVSKVNYETFYGQILPDLMRTFFVVLVQILIMRIAVVLFRRLKA